MLSIRNIRKSWCQAKENAFINMTNKSIKVNEGTRWVADPLYRIELRDNRLFTSTSVTDLFEYYNMSRYEIIDFLKEMFKKHMNLNVLIHLNSNFMLNGDIMSGGGE